MTTDGITPCGKILLKLWMWHQKRMSPVRPLWLSLGWDNAWLVRMILWAYFAMQCTSINLHFNWNISRLHFLSLFEVHSFSADADADIRKPYKVWEFARFHCCNIGLI